MKDNGSGYTFCQRVFLTLSLVLALEGVEIAVFQIMVRNSFLGQKKKFPFKFYAIELYICWIYMDFDQRLIYFTMQNYNGLIWG